MGLTSLVTRSIGANYDEQQSVTCARSQWLKTGGNGLGSSFHSAIVVVNIISDVILIIIGRKMKYKAGGCVHASRCMLPFKSCLVWFLAFAKC